VSPSLLVQLESGVDEVATQGGWLDAASLLPPALGQGDVGALLARCQAVAAAAGAGSGGGGGGGRKGGGKAAAAAAAVLGGGDDAPRFRKVELLAGSCVVAGPLLDALRESAEAAAKQAAEKAILERRAGGGGAGGSGKGGDAGAGGAAAAKGGGGGGGKGGGGDSDDDDWGRGGKKGGKKGGKGGGGKGAKGGGGGGGGAPKGGAAKGGGGGGEGGGDPALSLERLVDAVVEAHPDMEGAGQCGEGRGARSRSRCSAPHPTLKCRPSRQASHPVRAPTPLHRRRASQAPATPTCPPRSPSCCGLLPSRPTSRPSPRPSPPAPRRGARPRTPRRARSRRRSCGSSCTRMAARACRWAGLVQSLRGDAHVAHCSSSVPEGPAPSRLLLFGLRMLHAALPMRRNRPIQNRTPPPKDDESLQTLLARHAARTTGAEAVDALLRWCQLEFASDDEPPASAGGASEAPPPLAPGERSKIVKGLTPDVGGPVGKAVESLTAGGTQEVEAALEAAASECGLRLRRLDKKSEKAAVAAAKGRLMGLLADEQDPAVGVEGWGQEAGGGALGPAKRVKAGQGRCGAIKPPTHIPAPPPRAHPPIHPPARRPQAALALALPLLHLKAAGRLLSVPGRAMGPVLARLKDQLPPEGHALAQAFLDDVVESLKGGSGGEGGGDGAGAGAAERLAAALPGLKALAGLAGGEE
jgi:hypothetical protein